MNTWIRFFVIALVVVFPFAVEAETDRAEFSSKMTLRLDISCSEIPKCEDICLRFEKANLEFEKCQESKGSAEQCSSEENRVMGLVFQLMSCGKQHHPDQM